MPYTRMKRIFLQGLLWLYLLNFGYMALSLDNPGFLDFDNLPDTNFSCVGKVIGGYYADLETNCQMFHVCTIGQLDEPMDIRFLCLNGTVFDQETRVCERIDEVDCSKSEQFYSLNLELYGNSQPAILEESPETDQPLIIKSTTPTTTTTTSTTTPRPTLKTTRQPYYTTAAPPTITTSNSNHHFPIVNANSPDIRFNPEEINISLNPGAPPNIRTKPLVYQQQQHSYSSENNNNKGVVTTVLPNREQIHLTTQKPKSIVSYGLTHPGSQKIHQEQHQSVTPTDINFGFTFRQQEEQQQTEYHTEPQHNYHYQSNLANFRPSFLQHKNQFRPTTYRSEFTPTTLRNRYQQTKPTTMRAHYLQSLKPPQLHPHHYQLRTEKPQRLQLPLPLLPTISPLTFSSPAPFSLPRHIETKRYTKEHQSPPRIIISASASVSDASGRKLNYSLGQIGAAHILESPPNSYDEYKDEDVGLDPFYHDVPKVKHRNKRSVKHTDIIRSEQEAVDVLKFLFDWYKNHEQSSTISIPVSPSVITEINEEFAQKVEDESFKESQLFQEKSKFNIVGGVNLTEETTTKTSRRRGSRRFTPPVTEESTLEKSLSSTTQGKLVEMSRNSGQRPESTIDEQYAIWRDVNLNIGESGKTLEPRIDVDAEEEGKITSQGEETKTNEETVNLDTDPNPVITEETVKDTEANVEDIVHNTEIISEETPNVEVITEETPNVEVVTEETPNVEVITEENVTAPTTVLENTDNEESSKVENTDKEEILELTTTEKEIAFNIEHITENVNELINITAEDIITTDKIEIDTVSPETTEAIKPMEEVDIVPEELNINSGAKEENKPHLEENKSVDPEIKLPTLKEILPSTTTTTTTRRSSRRRIVSSRVHVTEENNDRRRGRGRRRFKTPDAPTLQVSSTTTEKSLDIGLSTIIETIEEPVTETSVSIPTEKVSEENVTTFNHSVDKKEEPTIELKDQDYINDNYEPLTYKDPDETVFKELEEEITEKKKFEDNTVPNDLKDNNDKKFVFEVNGSTLLVDHTVNYNNLTRLLDSSTSTTTIMTPTIQETITIATPETTSISRRRNRTRNRNLVEDTTTSTTTNLVETQEIDVTPFITTTEATTTEEAQVTPLETTTETTIFTTEDNLLTTMIKDEEILTTTTEEPETTTITTTPTTTTTTTTKIPEIETTTILEQIQEIETTTNSTAIETTTIFTTTPTTISTTRRKYNQRRTFSRTGSPRRPYGRHRFSSNDLTPRTTTIHQETTTEQPTKPPTTTIRHFIFNCFNRELNKFYPDPRDCRLFHYCTKGFSRNQLLDMKFVCDFNTYFDEERLICSRQLPERCT